MYRVAPRLPGQAHYAWLVLGLVFVTLIAAAAVRASPGVLIVPLEQAFGWSSTTISYAISLNLLLYGLVGPFAAALMQRFGVRRTAIGALLMLETGVLASTQMTQPWHLVVLWGLLVGAGAGSLGPVLGATVVNRWFSERRGLAMGIVTASSAAGQLIFLPTLASVAVTDGWRSAILVIALALAAMIPLVALFMPERPEAMGLRPYGDNGTAPPAKPVAANPLVVAVDVLGRAAKTGDFWIFLVTLMICGASANGLIGTHLVAFCFDNGIPEVQAAWLLAAMGAFNIVGSTLSGWLSDRYDNRLLLMIFFGVRGLSLLYLPYSHFDFATLSVFALFYGLDWIATVPPMMRLLTDKFGKTDAPVVYGWIFVGHQMGAGSIALVAGALRAGTGSYLVPFMLSGTLCIIASMLVLRISPPRLAVAGAD